MGEAARAGTAWRVPKDLKGNFRVLVRPNVGPFKAEQKSQWFKLDGGKVVPVEVEQAAG